jgi:hypothetical protein
LAPAPRDDELDGTLSAPVYISRLLAQATTLLDAHDTAGALSPLLEALSRSSPPSTSSDGARTGGQGLVVLHLHARALLCRWYLDAGEPTKALAELRRPSSTRGMLVAAEAIEDVALVARIRRSHARATIALLPSNGVDDDDRAEKLEEAATMLSIAAEGASARPTLRTTKI